MKNSLITIKVLLAMLLFQNLSAQVAIDFEFLDHTAKVTSHKDSKTFDSNLVYVAGRSLWPMTTVTSVNTLNNELDTILLTFYGQSDLTEFSDGTFDIYLHSMFDYDICVSGFFHIAYDGNAFKVDTFHSYILPDVFDDVYPHAVSKTADGNYYLMDFDFLYLSDKENLTVLRSANYFTKLFQNDARDVYLYEDSLVVKINPSSFDTLLNISNSITEIKNRGAFNDILLNGEIQTWNDDFSQLIYTWTFEDEIKSFYEVSIEDSLLTILSSEENDFKYRTISDTGDENIFATGNLNEEEAVGFHFLDDGSVLSINNYPIEEIETNQLLFRSFDFDEEESYQSREVSIDSASVFFQYADTLDTWVNNNGDTMYFVYNYFNVDVDYTNNSDVSVEQINILSSDVFMAYYFPETGLNFSINSNLGPTESTFHENNFYNYSLPSVITFGIPGADYRINNDPNRLFTTDVVLDISSVIIDVDIKLYPNPTNHILFIETEEQIDQFAIYNALGQLMMLKYNSADLNQTDVSALAPGSYFIKLRLKGKNEFGIQQFVKL